MPPGLLPAWNRLCGLFPLPGAGLETGPMTKPFSMLSGWEQNSLPWPAEAGFPAGRLLAVAGAFSVCPADQQPGESK